MLLEYFRIIYAQKLASRPFADRHVLNKAHIQGVIFCQVNEIIHFEVVPSPHQDHVDLDRVKACLYRSCYACFHLFQIPASHLVEHIWFKRVQADIDPIQARLLQSSGNLCQHLRVCGQREFPDLWIGSNSRNNLHNVPSQKGFPTRKAYAGNAKVHASISNPNQIPGIQLDLLGAAAFICTTIHAAQSAAFCDRKP